MMTRKKYSAIDVLECMNVEAMKKIRQIIFFPINLHRLSNSNDNKTLQGALIEFRKLQFPSIDRETKMDFLTLLVPGHHHIPQ